MAEEPSQEDTEDDYIGIDNAESPEADKCAIIVARGGTMRGKRISCKYATASCPVMYLREQSKSWSRFIIPPGGFTFRTSQRNVLVYDDNRVGNGWGDCCHVHRSLHCLQAS